MDSSSSSTFGSAHNLGQCAHSPRLKQKKIIQFQILNACYIRFEFYLTEMSSAHLSPVSHFFIRILYVSAIYETNRINWAYIKLTHSGWWFLAIGWLGWLVWRQTRLPSNVHRRHINQMFDQDHFKRGQTVRMQHQAWLRKSVAYRILAEKSFSELFKWRIYGD